MVVTVEQLKIYPIKSLGGISLSSATLTTAGLKGDREWMLINNKGKFVTQREQPLLATLRPSFINGQLFLTNQAGNSIKLNRSNQKKELEVFIWEDCLKALEANQEYSQWITDSVKSLTPLRLVYFDPQVQRTINHKRFGNGHTYFADGAPYLVANTESLNALNKCLKQQNLPPVSMDRFRANIVVSGLPAFMEQTPQKLSSTTNNITLELKDHCPRCAVITVDQNTGLRSYKAYPFKQLAQINAMPNSPKIPAFGMNSVLVSGQNNTIQLKDSFFSRKI